MTVKELDCLSELCPIPLIKVMQELKTMKPGDVLVLHSDHSCVAIDVERWAKEKKYPVQCIEDGGEWEMYIEKPKG
ncbi:sulfurtransferase TusA family protein [Haloimpatiens sp. FM7315]|uniref:sulfurtransferase TusA family protein n=1 Tax=Haloimpatiens sp. FM7315 TaxID=3298609 RepID=UPI0035A29728